MKFHHLFILIAVLLALPACERNQAATEKVKDTVNDALDRRPGEKIRDTVEDTKDAVRNASKSIKNAVKHAT
jgi:uncharacterized protein YjbJ (UPF0337 family)